MAVYRRSSRPRFTLLLVVLTSITLLTLDQRGSGFGVVSAARDLARDAFAPVQDAADAAFGPVGDFLQGALHFGDVEEENERLRAQLAEQEGDVLAARDANQERRALLDQQDLDFAADLPAVASRVVQASDARFGQTIELDRGRDAGVAPGMPVVAGSGLVGRVVDVSRRRATVLLITDPTSNVGVRLPLSGDVGVAAGRGRGSSLRVDLVAPDSVVVRGEVLVTSGQDQSAFPAGIPVAQIRAATAATGALQQDVTAEPVVDLDRLRVVKVIQWSGR
ncbi:MAG: rod shape-determining protein MreC [Acidimicrobiales bacterium]